MTASSRKKHLCIYPSAFTRHGLPQDGVLRFAFGAGERIIAQDLLHSAVMTHAAKTVMSSAFLARSVLLKSHTSALCSTLLSPWCAILANNVLEAWLSSPYTPRFSSAASAHVVSLLLLLQAECGAPLPSRPAGGALLS